MSLGGNSLIVVSWCLPEPKCDHGPNFIDECDNDCKCVEDGKYGCTRKLCKPGQTPEKPKTCSGADGLPKRKGQTVFCHEGKVKTMPVGKCRCFILGMYRSPVKECQVSCFVLGTIILNGTNTVVCKYCRTVRN